MRPAVGAQRSRRRGRQPPDGGRSRVRSLLPVCVLAVCMAVVLYGNVSFYVDKIIPAPSEEKWETAQHSYPHVDKNDTAVIPKAIMDIKMPVVEGAPEGGETNTNGGGEVDGVKLEVEGGIQEKWDDDSNSKTETIGGEEIKTWPLDGERDIGAENKAEVGTSELAAGTGEGKVADPPTVGEQGKDVSVSTSSATAQEQIDENGRKAGDGGSRDEEGQGKNPTTVTKGGAESGVAAAEDGSGAGGPEGELFGVPLDALPAEVAEEGEGLANHAGQPAGATSVEGAEHDEDEGESPSALEREVRNGKDRNGKDTRESGDVVSDPSVNHDVESLKDEDSAAGGVGEVEPGEASSAGNEQGGRIEGHDVQDVQKDGDEQGGEEEDMIHYVLDGVKDVKDEAAEKWDEGTRGVATAGGGRDGERGAEKAATWGGKDASTQNVHAARVETVGGELGPASTEAGHEVERRDAAFDILSEVNDYAAAEGKKEGEGASVAEVEEGEVGAGWPWEGDGEEGGDKLEMAGAATEVLEAKSVEEGGPPGEGATGGEVGQKEEELVGADGLDAASSAVRSREDGPAGDTFGDAREIEVRSAQRDSQPAGEEGGLQQQRHSKSGSGGGNGDQSSPAPRTTSAFANGEIFEESGEEEEGEEEERQQVERQSGGGSDRPTGDEVEVQDVGHDPDVEGTVRSSGEGKHEEGEGDSKDVSLHENETNDVAPKNGAVQGAMECAMIKEGAGAGSIVNIATWKDVPGDAEYRGPFHEESPSLAETRYVTLAKDLGGFNNIRMSLESAVAFAAATGRTFVIPPPFQIWNMNVGKPVEEVALDSLFSFDKLAASGRVRVITAEEFLEKEALSGNLGIEVPEKAKRLGVKAVSDYLTKVAALYEYGLPEKGPEEAGFVMPRRMGGRVDLETSDYALAKEWLDGRELTEYREGWQTAKIVHWRSTAARLLSPFYAFVLHADETSERYHSRLMRDLMHYPEEVYCKASQVISLIRAEDPSGAFSSFHIRRNDFLSFYVPVAIDPNDILKESEDHLIEGETIYIASDETDRSLFGVFKERFRVRFLEDYYEEAKVSEMNPNYIGMMEQIITSHGRTFTGCWFSTFTAYILRLRGHNGLPRNSTFYYLKAKKNNAHTTWLPSNPLWATEWPFGWEGIDDTGPPDPMAP